LFVPLDDIFDLLAKICGPQSCVCAAKEWNMLVSKPD